MKIKYANIDALKIEKLAPSHRNIFKKVQIIHQNYNLNIRYLNSGYSHYDDLSFYCFYTNSEKIIELSIHDSEIFNTSKLKKLIIEK